MLLKSKTRRDDKYIISLIHKIASGTNPARISPLSTFIRGLCFFFLFFLCVYVCECVD